MGQMDALALAGQCFLGILAFMAVSYTHLSNGITFGGIDSQFHLFAKPFFDESALAQQVAQGIRIALLDGGADAGDVVD